MCFSAEIGTNYMGQGGPISHMALFAEVAALMLEPYITILGFQLTRMEIFHDVIRFTKLMCLYCPQKA